MKKRGQAIFGMSYGVIFSIIIIIAIVAVAFTAINHFLKLSRCTEVGFFVEDLQDKIDKSWSSRITRGESFEGDLPSTGKTGITQVCFGYLNTVTTGDDEELRNKFDTEYSTRSENNLFFNPPNNACSGKLFANTLEHVDFQPLFFCVDVVKGKVEIKLDKERTETLVTLSE